MLDGYDTQTELLTLSGWKNCHELRVGDECGTVNLHTHFFEWQPVEKVVVAEAEQGFFCCEGDFVDVCATGSAGAVFKNKTKRHGSALYSKRMKDTRVDDRLCVSAMTDERGYRRLFDSEVSLLAWYLREAKAPGLPEWVSILDRVSLHTLLLSVSVKPGQFLSRRKTCEDLQKILVTRGYCTRVFQIECKPAFWCLDYKPGVKSIAIPTVRQAVGLLSAFAWNIRVGNGTMVVRRNGRTAIVCTIGRT
jgi:hypothetical protein